MKILLIISLLLLIPLVLAQNETELEVIITQPENNAEFNISTITLSAVMNKTGNMSHKLDNNNFTLECLNCSNFTTQLTNLTDGQHILEVLGEADNESTTTSVNFSINTTSNDVLEVIITQPQNLQEFNTTTITVSAEMNKQGNMSYNLDNTTFTQACIDCLNFTTEITDLSEETHELSVMGETENETTVTSIFFLINTTLPSDGNDSIPPPGNESNESDGDVPRFSLGFQKLPKQFANGEISNEELTNIILNNKLNPGIINRLSKTGKLSQENIDLIIDTQFLPPGILNKLLGLIGPTRNNNLEEFIENINLTDQQLSKLLKRNQIPELTAKKLISQQELGEKSIITLSKKSSEKILSLLIKKQTLTNNNIKNILEKNSSDKIIKQLIEHQILDEENINTIIDLTTNNDFLIKNQKLTNDQKNNLNVKEEKVKLTQKPVVIGKQQKKKPSDKKLDKPQKDKSKSKDSETTSSDKKDKSDKKESDKKDKSENGKDNLGSKSKSSEDSKSKGKSDNPGKSDSKGNSGKSSNSGGKGSNKGGKGKP